jgi:hypothetical protein
MGKLLKATQPEKCTGCELCILEAQRQLGRVGTEDAPIRIFRDLEQEDDGPAFSIEIDPRINSLDTEKIRNICPRDVLETQINEP